MFALEHVGEISQPIRGPSAWHVVRLDERRPAHRQTFDEARNEIMNSLRLRYIADQRDLRFKEINSDPSIEINQPAIDALVTHIDPALLDMPTPTKPGSPVRK